MKLLLHIGMHKTGTSALQALLRAQSDALMQQGVLYPSHGQHHDGAHHALWHALTDPDNVTEFVRSIWSEVEAAPAPVHTILLSSELLEKIGHDPVRRGAIGALLSRFASVDVLYFMRNQGELIESIFKQWIKDDAVRVSVGPSQFIAKHEPSLFYDTYADAWAELAPNVTVSCARYDGDWSNLWPTFARMAGLSLDGEAVSRNYNPSMDGERLKIKHWVNRNVPQNHIDFPLNAWLKRHFSNAPRTSMFRDAAAFAAFQDQYRASNARLAQKWGVEGLDEGRVSGSFFQTASPRLVDSFMTKLSDDPETSNSLVLRMRS